MSKNAAKMLAKEFRALGARAERDGHRGGTCYWFPDGSQRFIEHNIGFTAAHAILTETRRRYGRPSRAFAAPKTAGAPRVDLNRTTATVHAKDRLKLMRDQAGLTFLEVTAALTCPTRTRWDDKHQSWIWEGDRVAVAAYQTDDGHTTITTLLWTSIELWAQHPRPEKETA